MNKKKTAIGAVMLILLAGAGWAFGFFDTTDPQVAELQKLRKETFGRLDQMSDEERRSQFQEFRQRVDELSDEQRREFRESGREGFQQMMLQRMDRFFAMSPEDQTKELDEIIDRMEEWRANREQGGGGPGWGRGGGRGNMTAAQRDQRSKQRLDRSTPEMRAKMDRFRDIINERREERGLEPLEGGRGMFGGRGGRH